VVGSIVIPAGSGLGAVIVYVGVPPPAFSVGVALVPPVPKVVAAGGVVP
jgi:hypothetical protein